MTDDKATAPFVLRKKSPEELERIRAEREARHAEQQDAIRAAADEFMRPMAERARETMEAALAVHRLTIPDLSEIARQATPNLPEMWQQMQRATMPDLSEMVRRLTIPDELRMTPEEREQKEEERRMNELAESIQRNAQNDALFRRRIQDDRAQFRQALAADIAAAMVQAQGKSEPAQTVQAEPATPEADPVRKRRDCLRDAMESAFDVLEAELGRPPNDYEMRGYLKNRDTGGYITGSSDNLIFWLDWAGNKQTADKRNISERLKRILKSRNG